MELPNIFATTYIFNLGHWIVHQLTLHVVSKSGFREVNTYVGIPDEDVLENTAPTRVNVVGSSLPEWILVLAGNFSWVQN